MCRLASPPTLSILERIFTKAFSTPPRRLERGLGGEVGYLSDGPL